MSEDGIRIVWLPVNQAWMVMFHDVRLAGPFNDRSEAMDYIHEMKLVEEEERDEDS